MLFFQRKNNTFPSKQYSVIFKKNYKKIVIPIGRIPKKKIATLQSFLNI